MAGSVNKVILIGNLGRDPEIRTFQNGGRVANLSLATSERWTDRNSGEKRERTEWHRVVVLNDNLIQVVERFLKKGSKVYVEGQLETRKWQEQSGQDRYTTEVVLRPFRSELTMLDSRQSDGGAGYGGSMGGGMGSDVNPYDDGPSYGSRDRAAEPAGGPQGGSQGGPPADLDDEIPF